MCTIEVWILRLLKVPIVQFFSLCLNEDPGFPPPMLELPVFLSRGTWWVRVGSADSGTMEHVETCPGACRTARCSACVEMHS